MRLRILLYPLLLAVLCPWILRAQMYLPAFAEGDQIVRHAYFTLKYDEKYEQADWVAYLLTAEMLAPVCKRSDDFRPDPLVKTGSATPSDYRKSGYDKGHLAPAADMAFSCEAMSETFYMSNMSPQLPAFNRGIWKDLEELVRKWAKENDEIQVVTGPVLKDGGFAVIGAGGVAVPRYFYKVVLDDKEPEIKAIAFILPNQKSDKEIQSYALTVNMAEEATGIDFFPELDDGVEEEIESSLDLGKWGFTAVQVTDARVNSGKPHRVNALGEEACRYWLNTSSVVRHNRSCPLFGNTKHGRCCGANEGKPCSRCGG